MGQKATIIYFGSRHKKGLIMISVYGGTGFIGSVYCSIFNDECLVIPRSQKTPETNNILYFISTFHNYNVFEEPHLDINTNLNLLTDIVRCSPY